MSSPLNQVQLTGRAGHDVDLHALTDGTPFARLRLYHDAKNDGDSSTALPFTVTAWGRLADAFHGGVRKGDRLFIQGRLRLRSWKEKGVRQTRPEIHLETFLVLQKRQRTGEGVATSAAGHHRPSTNPL